MMNRYLKIFILLCMLVPLVGNAELTNQSYWKCSTQDEDNNNWLAISFYKKVAINKAFEACKKDSTNPQSCKTSSSACDQYVNGKNTSPQWQCTALDQNATPWRSTLYRHREDAALGAKAFCKANSLESETCYIDMVTCRNLNSEEYW